MTMKKMILMILVSAFCAVTHAQTENEPTVQTPAEEYADRQEIENIHLKPEQTTDDITPPPEHILLNEYLEEIVPE